VTTQLFPASENMLILLENGAPRVRRAAV